MSWLSLGIEAVERGWVPDSLTRHFIRNLCGERLIEPPASARPQLEADERAFRRSLREGPVALVPDLANAQHYEIPPEFFELVLGPRRKYSCCYFPTPNTSLAEAEEHALRITANHARLENGQTVLELGCGWGSLSLWMAEHYPLSQITAVSNSAPQRQHIERQAAARGLTNLRVITADMNDFAAAPAAFDRVVSVEMFEHMRNYSELLRRISGWLKPDGLLFVHIFCHQTMTYPYETAGASNWMGQYFFTGGLMPGADLLREFPEHLKVIEQSAWRGTHYFHTAEAWLANLDQNRQEVLKVLANVYGRRDASRWFYRWRMFMMAVAELFAFHGGQEWYVSHYLLSQAALAHPSAAPARDLEPALA